MSGILGYQPPAPEAARQWLERLHEGFLAVARLRGSFIPAESRPLAALKEVKRRTVSAYVEAVHPEWHASLDVDVQLTETTKEWAQYCYEGYKGVWVGKGMLGGDHAGTG